MSTRGVRLAAILGTVLMLAGACTRPPQPGGGTPPPGADRSVPGPSWRAVPDERLPDAVRDWLRPRLSEVGLAHTRHADEVFVAVTWGQRRTAGYTVRIEDVRTAGDVLLLAVHLAAPAPDEPVAQVITHPHAVAAVRPAADYRLAPVFLGSHFLQNSAFEVLEPMPFTRLGEEVRVRGRARVFEASFMVRVEDAEGTLLEQPAMASEGAPGWGEFDLRLSLPRAPRGAEGRVVLFEASAEDGSPIHVIAIPVRFGR